MIAIRLLISGRVQGVGYRDWLVAEAARHGAAGWVRNTGDAQVEALIQAEENIVRALIEACRTGPSYARVTHIAEHPAGPVCHADFRRLPSA